jgi:hypothetical protein
MTVPFESIGGSQVGRLVFQVIGKDGPVFNPNNIKFLPFQEAPSAVVPPIPLVANLGELGTGLLGLNLIASLANVGLSTAILWEVRKTSQKIDGLRQLSLTMLEDLDWIKDRLISIDVKVSEDRLGKAVSHISEKCHNDYTIDLMEIKRLAADLGSFISSLDTYGYCCRESFTLSSHMQDRLNNLYSLLYGTRELVARRHNVRSQGDPFRMLTVHPIHDYAPVEYSGYKRAPLIIKGIDHDIESRASETGDRVKEISWRGGRKKEEIEPMIKGIQEMVRNRFDQADELSYAMYDSIKPVIEEIMDVGKVMILIEEFEKYWLLRTDMGLVWRLRKELDAIGDYAQVFKHWKQSDPVRIGSDEFLVDNSWGKPFELQSNVEQTESNT